ncbi:MAG: PGF-CTERM sorting domain-containing protein [Methanocorpusculum sp.]|nr:PGF-CTERM sorting domain-containing protein [Methanocorpusculum sp.]
MNAKKIMGAVLVALLAAALFVGAGAAATDIGTVTTYTDLTSSGTFAAGQTFYATDGTAVTVVDFGGAIYFAADESQLNKKYTGHDLTFKLVAPTAVVAALDENGIDIIGKTVSASVANNATFTYTFNNAAGTAFIFIDENGVMYNTIPAQFQAGKWGVAADLTGNSALVTPDNVIIMGQVYYFTVAKTEASITAVKDTVNKGEVIVLKIQYPGADDAVTVGYDSKKVKAIQNQIGVEVPSGIDNKVYVDLGIDGTASIAFQSIEKGNAKFTLVAPGNPKVTVSIVLGEITASATADSFFTGNAISLTGTTTAGSDLFFYIEGTNFPLTQINSAKSGFENHFATDGELEVEKNDWTVAIDSTIKHVGGQKLVAGTYTVIVSTYDLAAEGLKDEMSAKESIMDATYGVAAVTLTQPFIENVKANAVAIQELEYEVTGTAYAADGIRYYIFGTNYFKAGDAEYDEEEETFKFSLTPAQTKGMDVGTYIYLVQHPMGDKLFNVWNGNATAGDDAAVGPTNNANVKGSDFYYAATATPLVQNATFLFNAYERGTNYAAQALLDAIAGQDIDDVFVQGIFKVEAQKLTINAIPSQVAQGSSLTVSGTSNCGEGTEVIVNVYEGTFGATTKGDENAATFLTNKAVTKADGTWEAAIDTNKLKLGTYTVTVELNGNQFDSESVEIVAAGDEPVTPPADDEPVTPPADDEPVAPETPGFGALAALAGLGAVAVLLLRRE